MSKKDKKKPQPEPAAPEPAAGKKARNKAYEAELARLQVEIANLQAWVKASGARVVILFEGRDAAGKGGMIKRLTEKVSPRVFRVVALPAPSDRQKTQLYMQRYIEQLPAAGEVLIFDRSWYNRPGVERVMGYCTQEAATRFLQEIPHLEALITESGILLLKYFLTVGEEEQERRFHQRIDDPVRQWKLSPMDLESYRRWWDYSARLRRDAAPDRHPACALVARQFQRQEGRAHQLPHSPARLDPLREGQVRRAEAGQATEAPRRLRRRPHRPQRGAHGVLSRPRCALTDAARRRTLAAHPGRRQTITAGSAPGGSLRIHAISSS